MAYKFKSDKIIIDGTTKIIPKTLPSSPEDNELAIDITDNKLKVWNGAKWIVLGNAADIEFDNSSANLPENPQTIQAAIEALKSTRFQFVQFQLIGKMDYNQYLYSTIHSGGKNRRSGDSSNGYRYSNSAPLTIAFSGNIKKATASIRGIAVSTGGAASNIELKFELWSVGCTSEGIKLGDVIFNITSSNYTIGTYWNSSITTCFHEEQNQNIAVEAGHLLALKFIRQTGNDKVVSVENTTIVLQIEGSV